MVIDIVVLVFTILSLLINIGLAIALGMLITELKKINATASRFQKSLETRLAFFEALFKERF